MTCFSGHLSNIYYRKAEKKAGLAHRKDQFSAIQHFLNMRQGQNKDKANAGIIFMGWHFDLEYHKGVR